MSIANPNNDFLDNLRCYLHSHSYKISLENLKKLACRYDVSDFEFNSLYYDLTKWESEDCGKFEMVYGAYTYFENGLPEGGVEEYYKNNIRYRILKNCNVKDEYEPLEKSWNECFRLSTVYIVFPGDF